MYKVSNLIACLAIVGMLVGCSGRLSKSATPVSFNTEHLKCGNSEVTLGTAGSTTETQDPVILFYFHGLGQTYKEPFKLPAKKPYAQSALDEYPKLTIASCNYSEQIVWYTPETLASATCGINHLFEKLPGARIILAGTSMGGCAALSYAVIAPEQIRKRIIGVVAVYASGDLARLYGLTKEKKVTDGLLSGFGGTPEQKREGYNRSSLVPNLATLPEHVRIYLISANHDVTIPTVMQQELYKLLVAKHIACKLESFEGTHLGPPISGSFERGLRFVLSDK